MLVLHRMTGARVKTSNALRSRTESKIYIDQAAPTFFDVTMV